MSEIFVNVFVPVIFVPSIFTVISSAVNDAVLKYLSVIVNAIIFVVSSVPIVKFS